jgi:hypothetical protein
MPREDVYARDKRGHDGEEASRRTEMRFGMLNSGWSAHRGLDCFVAFGSSQ